MAFPQGSLGAAAVIQCFMFIWLAWGSLCLYHSKHASHIQHIPHSTKKKSSFPRDNASISPAQAPLCAYTPPHTSQLGSFTYTQCGKTKTGNEIQASDCCQGDGSVVSAVIVHALINLSENEWKFIELTVYAEWPLKTEMALDRSRHFVTYYI